MRHRRLKKGGNRQRVKRKREDLQGSSQRKKRLPLKPSSSLYFGRELRKIAKGDRGWIGRLICAWDDEEIKELSY